MRNLTCRSILSLIKINSLQSQNRFGGILVQSKFVQKQFLYCTITNDLSKAEPVKIVNSNTNLDDNLYSFDDIESSMQLKNVLEPPSTPEEIDVVCPPPPPLNAFATFADKSETLQKFIKLGVNIGQWNKHVADLDFLVNLDFEIDIKPYVFLIHNAGVSAENIGRFFTKNPHIFLETLENVAVRINYLESKKFTTAEIGRILTHSPNWLQHRVLQIDEMLGILQKMFQLSGNEVRIVTVKNPNLITNSIKLPIILQVNNLFLRNEMGFNDAQVKKLLLTRPRIFIEKPIALNDRLQYITSEMGLQCSTIVEHPTILLLRKRKLLERHGFLSFLGMDQYDATKPNFISPSEFSLGNDEKFAENVASTHPEKFIEYLKTM